MGKKTQNIREFNPYELNFDFIESIPEDEWKKLILSFTTKEKGVDCVAINYSA